MADGLTKALGPERHRKLTKMMGMGTWEKPDNYDITNSERSPKIRSGSDAGTSSPASPGQVDDVASDVARYVASDVARDVA